VTGSNGDDHGQSPGNRDFGENLSGNGRDGIEERQHIVFNGLLQDFERDRMEPQVLLLARQRVNASIRIKGLRVRSTNLDKRVQVGYPFIIRVVEIDLPLRTDGSTGGSDLIPKFLLDLWVLGELEEGERQCGHWFHLRKSTGQET